MMNAMVTGGIAAVVVPAICFALLWRAETRNNGRASRRAIAQQAMRIVRAMPEGATEEGAVAAINRDGGADRSRPKNALCLAMPGSSRYDRRP